MCGGSRRFGRGLGGFGGDIEVVRRVLITVRDSVCSMDRQAIDIVFWAANLSALAKNDGDEDVDYE